MYLVRKPGMKIGLLVKPFTANAHFGQEQQWRSCTSEGTGADNAEFLASQSLLHV